MVLYPYRATSRASPSMWLTEGFMQIIVHSIESHPTGVCLTKYRIEVGTVVIHLSASRMHNLSGFSDLRLENAQRTWIGNHHRGGIFADC